jgi:hypothetical protein
MKKKIMCICFFAVALIAICLAIVITNVKFHNYMKPTKVSGEDNVKGVGYELKLNKYEVLDMEEMKEYVTDIEQYELYKKTLGFEGKVVLVYVTLNVSDREAMNKEWWTDFILYADNAWHNAVEVYLASLIKDANPAKGNYEDGGTYEMIFPFCIGENQVPEWEYRNVKNWKYSMAWSRNPIVYMNIN